MFSHIIHNPNQFIISNDYHIIPFGHRCTSALACKYANIRKCSLPFDWINPLFPKKIKRVLENNFDDFIPNDFIPYSYNGFFNKKYDFALTHFNPDINNGVEEYKRRIARFNTIINQPTKKYFIYINEDYIYDANYRNDEFNDTIFNDMLELECFIKEKYVNIDYNILYFNFKKHDIPTNSNIINIVLHTNMVYDKKDDAPFEILRHYCGKILADFFNTRITVFDYMKIFGYEIELAYN